MPTASDPAEKTPPPGSPPIRRVGIIGTGVMGRGIAAAVLRAGARVCLLDANRTAAERAAADLLALTDSANAPWRTAADASRVSVATTEADMATADIVIEAVPENVAIKSDVYSRLEPHLSPNAVVATNASSIPISELGAHWTNPHRFCGLHFCHPVDQRLLVEVIPTPLTSAETITSVHHFAATIGKRPLLVRDGPGFLLNRVLSPYLAESLELLLEGASPQLLDQVAADFGMPWGPLQQLDEFGLDVALAVGGTLLRAYPDRFIPAELLIALYKANRLGRKSGRGILLYNASGQTEDL
ncbi:MAG: 3-hydroxyacyl-CoA dehydrogenase family protein, partial [Planctomycetaceae bacterium]|nr:3-hydroxyacyl-CoA dehydrogenase family protein [Planctomycetaceae bacterium]